MYIYLRLYVIMCKHTHTQTTCAIMPVGGFRGWKDVTRQWRIVSIVSTKAFVSAGIRSVWGEGDRRGSEGMTPLVLSVADVSCALPHRDGWLVRWLVGKELSLSDDLINFYYKYVLD